MELLQFRYFLEAARYQNLTRAAEELHIAQPALTQSIKRLEAELGVDLFDRKNHRVILNEQGKFLEKRLLPIMGTIDHLKDELWESVDAAKQTIYLNFFAASPFITSCIIAYRSRRPEVKFQVSQLDIGDACDIHIDSRASVFGDQPGEKEILPAGVIRREVLQDEIFLAVPASSPLAARESIDLRELKDQGFIRLDHSWQLRGICDEYCRRVGIHPPIIFESNSPESVRNLIVAGLGVGFWPKKSWGGLPEDRVALVPIGYPVCSRDLLLTVFEQAKEKAAVMEFLTFMCETFHKSAVPDAKIPRDR